MLTEAKGMCERVNYKKQDTENEISAMPQFKDCHKKDKFHAIFCSHYNLQIVMRTD